MASITAQLIEGSAPLFGRSPGRRQLSVEFKRCFIVESRRCKIDASNRGQKLLAL
jgi:hypothetical protein